MKESKNEQDDDELDVEDTMSFIFKSIDAISIVPYPSIFRFLFQSKYPQHLIVFLLLFDFDKKAFTGEVAWYSIVGFP